MDKYPKLTIPDSPQDAEDSKYPKLTIPGDPASVSKKFPKLTIPGEDSKENSFAYGYATGSNFVTNLGSYLERSHPMGRIEWYTPGEGWHWPTYTSPEELYGKGATPEEIQKTQENIKKSYIESRFPVRSQLSESQNEGFGESAGGMAAAIVDPSTLSPAGRTVLGTIVMGGLIGGADMAAYGLAEDNKVDPALTAIGAGGGAIAGGALTYLGGKMSRMVQKASNKSANKLLDNLEDGYKYYMGSDQGYTPMEAIRQAKSDLGIDEDALVGLVAKTGRKPRFTTKTIDPVVEETNSKIASLIKKSGVNPDFYGLSQHLDDYIGTVQTRIHNISAGIGNRLDRLDANESIIGHQFLMRVKPFTDELKALPKAERKVMKLALYNGDDQTIKRIMATRPAMKAAHTELRSALDDMANMLEQAGYDMKRIDDYFPRMVKDLPALQNALPGEVRTALEKKLMGKSLEEQGVIVNQYLRNRLSGITDARISNVKHRAISELSPELLQHYADPEEALHGYIRRVVHDTERRNFFGRGENGVFNPGMVALDSHGDVNIRQSVGNLIAEELQAGRIKPQDVQELHNILTARFDAAGRTGSVLSGLKNIMYASTIGNPVSAVTQIGDLGVSAYAHGVINTVKSLFGKKYVDLADIGARDLAHEFSSTAGTSKFLNVVFKYSGFRAIDELGKTTSINAAFRKNMKLALGGEKGVAKLREKWGPVFGQEFPQVLDDLQNGRVSQNVKMMMFTELAKLQPISLSQMPAKYIQHPNGRIFYMLKTFTLKQMDIMRQDIWNQFRRGSKVQATKNAVRYVALLSMFNYGAQKIKEFMLSGEPPKFDDWDDAFIDNLWKNFGASEYVANKYLPGGKMGSFLGDIIGPPLNVVDAIGGVFLDPSNMAHNAKYIPIVGKMWYYWMGDGLEKMKARQEKQ